MQSKRSNIANNAVSRFLNGYNCAESVLLTLSRHQGKKSSLIPRIATPFGGGIARSGSIFGCVTGALMVIGINYGRNEATGDKEKAYSAAAKFLNEFERRFGSLICCELVGCNLRTPEGHKRWEQLKEGKCANFVKGAVDILIELERQTSK